MTAPNERTERLKMTLEEINNLKADNDYISQVRYGPSIDEVLNSDKDIDIATEEIKQNFILLFFTMPGEIHTDLNRGIGIQRFLFEMSNGTTRSSIDSLIRAQVSTYLPNIAIRTITFDLQSDSNSIYIKIKYYIPSLDVNDGVTFDLDKDS